MKKLKDTALATAAAGALMLGMGIGSANALQILDAWKFNLSVANGVAYDGGGGSFAGLGDITNIDHLNLVGVSTITQTVVGGVALGNSFVDDGTIFIANSIAEGAIIPVGIPTGTAAALYFDFAGLTGTLNGDGSITFDPGGGLISLVLDSDTDGSIATGDIVTLATFEVVAPSGGSNLDFFGGTAANSTIDLTLEQITGLAGLYEDSDGNELSFDLTLHLGDVDALLNPNFDPNPDNTGIDQFGDGVSIIHVQNAGQYNVAIPEPASLGMLGVGLLVLAGVARRRRKKA